MPLEDYRSFEEVPAKHEIAFIGRSNVGKSTLMRDLVGAKVKVGRRPGVTQKPNYYRFDDLLITDMPGYGFMKGVDRAKRERIKDLIVQYFEEHAGRVLCAVQVVDAKAFAEVVDRWDGRGEVPVDVELHDFLRELGIDVVVAANKMDKVPYAERDGVLDGICVRLHMLPPWHNWLGHIVPISAKMGELGPLRTTLKDRLRAAGLERYVNVVK